MTSSHPHEETAAFGAAAVAAGDATGWFERLYASAAAGEAAMPWDRTAPNPLLVSWASSRQAPIDGRAVVVGCGLGADAEFLASMGCSTLAFDISPTAVELARSRFPSSAVSYVPGDLLALPDEWVGAYDLVYECNTVQSLPDPLKSRAIPAVSSLLAAGGTLLVLAAVADGEESSGPPWPLTRAELDAFAVDGVEAVRVEELPDPNDPSISRWRAEFRRVGRTGFSICGR